MQFRFNVNFYIRQRDALLKRLRETGPFICGSLIEVEHGCGKKGCSCQKGKKHKGYYLTDKLKGRSRVIYISKGKVEEIRRWVEEYRYLKTLIRGVTKIQGTIIREYAREKKYFKGTRNY